MPHLYANDFIEVLKMKNASGTYDKMVYNKMHFDFLLDLHLNVDQLIDLSVENR